MCNWSFHCFNLYITELSGPPGKKVAWYEYHPTRAAYNAREFLQGYSGYLQTDGYEGYDCAVKDMPGIIHAGCFAHYLRRKIIRGKHRNYRLYQYLA